MTSDDCKISCCKEKQIFFKFLLLFEHLVKSVIVGKLLLINKLMFKKWEKNCYLQIHDIARLIQESNKFTLEAKNHQPKPIIFIRKG